uniref:Ig-like domain-containing protein n=1 Tax=Esox lucius TaxID=8010 RepID=A0AAY5KE67_ESOLU
ALFQHKFVRTLYECEIVIHGKLFHVSGSCVQIPCTFDIPDDNINEFKNTVYILGVWMKESHQTDQKNVIFNSSKNDNRYQGNITGNLSQKNCTTVFFNVTNSYTNKYYFRIESKPYSATDNEKPLFIHYFFLFIFLVSNVKILGDIKEGTPVSLNCSAVAPCPEHHPKLIWTLPTKSTHEIQIQENTNQTITVLSTVTFIPSYLHNEKNITCTAVYPVGMSNKTVELTRTLHVLCKILSVWIYSTDLYVEKPLNIYCFFQGKETQRSGGLLEELCWSFCLYCSSLSLDGKNNY